jgi:outer membrane protein OmpA-like peptidoglycan-associated protein
MPRNSRFAASVRKDPTMRSPAREVVMVQTSVDATAAMIAQREGSRQVRRRLLVRREASPAPGAWRGWLPAVGLAALFLYALGPFARQVIEGAVRERVAAQLQRDGFGWVDVSVSGQQVLLAGTLPTLDDGPKALRSATDAQCPTWAGPRTCAVVVVPAFLPPVPAAPALPAVAATSAAAPASAPLLPAPRLDESACRRSLAEVTEGWRLEFETGQAQVKPESEPLLARLADVLARCPGRFRIEGHTDDVGSADANLALARARADAVKSLLVSKGVGVTRLETAGYGASRPRADNATDEGRTRNRRIEIHSLPTP